MKITFKKQPKETGLSAIAHPNQDTDIKVDGKVIGCISGPNAFSTDTFKVRFIVYKNENDKIENCPWKWVKLKREFDTETEAREWVKCNLEKLNLKLYSLE